MNSKSIYLSLLTSFGLFIILIVLDVFKFGHGIGDLVYLIAAITLWLTFASLFAFVDSSKFSNLHRTLNIIFIIIFILFLLKATIFRGAEYLW